MCVCRHSLQDGTTDVVIPDVSLDSADLIRSATDVDVGLVLENIEPAHTVEKPNSGSDVSSESATPSLASVALEEESQWLRQFLSQEKDALSSDATTLLNEVSIKYMFSVHIACTVYTLHRYIMYMSINPTMYVFY